MRKLAKEKILNRIEEFKVNETLVDRNDILSYILKSQSNIKIIFHRIIFDILS